MCVWCGDSRYQPSVGDLYAIDGIENMLGPSNWGPIFSRWRRHLEAQEARAGKAEAVGEAVMDKLSDTEGMCTTLRERLAKADQTIAKDMDVALGLVARVNDPGEPNAGRALDELREILTSVRRRYGPDIKKV